MVRTIVLNEILSRVSLLFDHLSVIQPFELSLVDCRRHRLKPVDRLSATAGSSDRTQKENNYMQLPKIASAEAPGLYETIRHDQPAEVRPTDDGRNVVQMTDDESASHMTPQRAVSLGDEGELTVVDNALYASSTTRRY
jgi:hypothetical protein